MQFLPYDQASARCKNDDFCAVENCSDDEYGEVYDDSCRKNEGYSSESADEYELSTIQKPFLEGVGVHSCIVQDL